MFMKEVIEGGRRGKLFMFTSVMCSRRKRIFQNRKSTEWQSETIHLCYSQFPSELITNKMTLTSLYWYANGSCKPLQPVNILQFFGHFMDLLFSIIISNAALSLAVSCQAHLITACSGQIPYLHSIPSNCPTVPKILTPFATERNSRSKLLSQLYQL